MMRISTSHDEAGLTIAAILQRADWPIPLATTEQSGILIDAEAGKIAHAQVGDCPHSPQGELPREVFARACQELLRAGYDVDRDDNCLTATAVPTKTHERLESPQEASCGVDLRLDDPLRSLLSIAGATIKQAAEAVGCTYPNVQQSLGAGSNIRVATLLRYASALRFEVQLRVKKIYSTA